MKKILIIVLLCLFPSPAFATIYWVDADGPKTNLADCDGAVDPGDANRCTMAAVNAGAVAGDVIYLMDDKGNIGTGIAPTNSGTEGNPITYEAYTGETPVITGNIIGITLNSDDWIVVRGITFGSLVSNIARFYNVRNGSSYNEFDSCTFQGPVTVEGGKILAIPPDAACTYNWIHDCTFAIYSEADAVTCQDVETSCYIGYSADRISGYNVVEDNVFYWGGHANLEVGTVYNIIRNNVFHNEGNAADPGIGVCSWRPSTRNSLYGNRNLLLSDESASNTDMYNVVEGNRVGHAAFSPGDKDGAGAQSGAQEGNIVINSRKNIVRYNDAYYSETFGLAFKNAQGNYNRAYNNSLYYNGQDSSNYPTAWSGYGDTDWRGGVGCHPSTTTSNILKNNIIYGSYSNRDFMDTSNYSCTGLITDTNNWITTTGNPLFVDTTVADPTSLTLPNLSLQSGSTAINGGTYLTQANGGKTASDTLEVDDATYFQDGRAAWPSGGPAVYADHICVGTVSNCGQIASINYTTNTITLSGNLTWLDNASVWLYKKSDGVQVLYGSAPDYGAHESDTNEPTISNAIPSGTQVCTGPTQSVTIGVMTNEAATCIYSPVDDDFLDMSNYNSGVTFTNTGGTSHSGVTTLASNCSYIFYATCMDTSGVSNGASGTQIYFNINECTPVVEQGQVISPGAGAVKTVAPSTPGSGVFKIQ